MSSSKPGNDPPARLPRHTARLERHTIALRVASGNPKQVGGLLAAVIRYLGRGVRSRKGALAYLRQRGASPSLAAQLVEECSARRLLDDRACAALWAEHWARRGYAWMAIRQKLIDKGLDAEAIESAAQRLGTVADERERARSVVAEHALRSSGRQRARLARTLASRGFDPDLIDQILDESFDSPAKGGLAQDEC